MFREKEICNAIRTAYLYLFPDKKERKRALSRLNMELVAQSVRYRGESVLAYQTAGNHECSLNYYGPELFPQRGFCIYQKTIQSHSTQVDASCIRELWLLEDGRFVDVSCVNTKYRSAYERFSTCYRTIHHIPNIIIRKTKPIGHYGRLRKAYLEMHRPILFNELVLSDKLFEHCAEIEEAARNRMELIVRSLAEQNGVTEQLKAENQMEWVRQMNACKAQAEEIVKAELIYD